IRLIGVPPTAEAAIAKAWAAVERANGIPVTAWALADLVALAKDLDGLGTLARGLREAGVVGLADVRLDLVEDPAVQWVVDAGLGVPVGGVHDAPANPVVFLRRFASLQTASRSGRGGRRSRKCAATSSPRRSRRWPGPHASRRWARRASRAPRAPRARDSRRRDGSRIPDRPPRRGQLSQHAAAGRGPRRA